MLDTSPPDHVPEDCPPGHDECENCGDLWAPGGYGHPISLRSVSLGRDEEGQYIGSIRACSDCEESIKANRV
jgi:hypothetical protein